MIIVHENLKSEAQHISNVLRETLGIKSSLESQDMSFLFKPLPKFNAFWQSADKISKHFYQRGEKAVIALTSKDLYFCDKSQEDDWCFAYADSNQKRVDIVISTARLKGKDSQPTQKLEISKELYYERLKVLALHELGHDIVNGQHLRKAFWVNTKTGYSIDTEYHCPNNNCTLYQVGDIQTPKPTEGYIRIGRTKRFDTGLDDLISRLPPEYFCDDCLASINIGKKYK